MRITKRQLTRITEDYLNDARASLNIPWDVVDPLLGHKQDTEIIKMLGLVDDDQRINSFSASISLPPQVTWN